MSADGPVRPTGQTAGPGQASGWPAWSGPVPPLAEGFTVRPDTVPDLEIALVPGATVVLVPDQAPGSAQDWRATPRNLLPPRRQWIEKCLRLAEASVALNDAIKSCAGFGASRRQSARCFAPRLR